MRFSNRGLIVALSALSAPLSAAPQSDAAWQCKFNSLTICGPKGCTKGTNQTWIYLTAGQNSYWRCSGEGFDKCDYYKANVFDSGAYKVFELTDHAAFAKVDENLTVTETLSQMDLVYINRGKCISAPPPLIRTDR